MSKCRCCGLDHPAMENCGVARRKAVVDIAQAPAVQETAVSINKKQRWDRGSYNNYMREYMRKRRMA